MKKKKNQMQPLPYCDSYTIFSYIIHTYMKNKKKVQNGNELAVLLLDRQCTR